MPTTGNGVYGPEPGEPNAGSGQAQSIQDIIAEVARDKGVPVELALAIAQVESNFDPNVIGDSGHSVGLFQLNDRGEGAGLSVQDRQDPRRNAEIALTQVANVYRAHPDWSPGQIAAAAQRPLDPQGYAAKVNSVLQNGVSTSADSTAGGATYQTNTNTTANGGPRLDAQSLASEYGFAAAFFSIDPELQNLLNQAVSQQWTPQQFIAKFQASKWYQDHAQSVRDYLTLQSSDPATFQAKLDQEVANVKSQASQLGAQLDDATLKELASNALEFGWDSTQLQQALGAHVSATSGGQAGANLTQMKQYVQDMGIYMSDDTLQSYLRGISSGTSSVQDFQNQVRKLAISAFPGYSQQLGTGMTMKDIADPYMQDMASILEIDPSQVNLYDPTIRKALTGDVGANGQAQPTSLWQFEQGLRQDPRWQYTANAQNAGYSLLHQIGKSWGFES